MSTSSHLAPVDSSSSTGLPVPLTETSPKKAGTQSIDSMIDSGRLERALYTIDEILSYYPFGFNLTAVGQTLTSVLNGVLEGDGLYFSIPENDIDATNPHGNRYNELKAALKSLQARPEVSEFHFTDNTLSFTYNKVPVHISVHKKSDKFFAYPAVKQIGDVFLQIPNPILDYLKEVEHEQ